MGVGLGFELDIKEVHQANRRVEDALNRRFEKDAEMYISNQDIALIKEWLSDGEYELMFSKYTAEHYHPDVFFRTILRNAWLIKEIKPAQFKKYIRPILEKMQPEYSKQLLKEVAENKMDVPQAFRESLLGHYANSIDHLEAEDMLLSGSSLGLKRVKVLVQRVLGYYAGQPKFFTKFNSFLKEYPALNSDQYILNGVEVDEDLMKKHLELIVNEIDRHDDPPRYLITTLGPNKMNSFPLVYEKAKATTEKIAKQARGVRDNATYEKMKLWLKLLRSISDQIFFDSELSDKHEYVYKKLTSLYDYIYRTNSFIAGNVIRYSFSKVRSEEWKTRLVEYLLDNDYHERFETDVEDMKFGSDSEFDDVLGLIDALYETDASNTKRLQYLAITFSSLNNLENHLNQLLTQIDLSDDTHENFIIALLGNRKKSIIWKKFIEYAERSAQMDKLVYRAICEYVPQDKTAKVHMHKNHFHKFTELYGV